MQKIFTDMYNKQYCNNKKKSLINKINYIVYTPFITIFSKSIYFNIYIISNHTHTIALFHFVESVRKIQNITLLMQVTVKS